MDNNSQIPDSKFERMLGWLHDDREQAARKYEAIRRRLIEILASRGCPEAEHWADVAIDRVVSKIDEVPQGYVGDPAHYFYGVAKKVALECLKPRPRPYMPPDPPPDDGRERDHDCLEHCLAKLSHEDRELILGYYAKERREKIISRNELARKLKIALNALRIRVYRIRIGLKDCIEDCLGRETP